MGTIQFGSGTIAFDDFNPGGDAVPLVLLHAFPLNRRMWDPQIGALRGTCRVVAVDLPGFGESSDFSPPQGLDGMADTVAAVLDALSCRRAILVGLSMGGYVALAFGRRHPERLAGLVLADTRASADSELARASRFQMIDRINTEGIGFLADAMLPNFLTPASIRESPEIEANIRALIGAASPSGVIAAISAMAARSDSSDLLPGIKVPTLVIVGSADPITPPAEARSMAESIPGAGLIVIENASHLSNLERPSEFTRALLEFLIGFQNA